MSQNNAQSSNVSPEPLSDTDREQYRTPVVEDIRNPEMDAEGHVVEDTYEDDVDGWQIDPQLGIKRFVDLYDHPRACVREYISNAETACKRRAQAELREVGYTDDELDDMGFIETIETAEEETGYRALIEIEFQQGDPPMFRISDNGCGISVKEWRVLTEVGLSASHDCGERLGKFGMGVLSAFKMAGMYNPIHMWTKSVFDDASYAYGITIQDPEGEIPGGRDEYGTTFKFALSDEAADVIDMADAVDHFAEALKVPLLYTEYDEHGNPVDDEDYTPQRMEQRLNDDTPYVVVDNEFVRAVAHPHASEDTYLVTAPIGRNDSTYSSEHQSPWQFDMRVKREDGAIYESHNESHVGKIPLNDSAYEGRPDDRKDRYIPESEVDATDMRLPEPTGSRDQFESQYVSDFCNWVSGLLQEQFQDRVADVFQSVSDMSDLFGLDTEARAFFDAAFDHEISYSHRTNGDSLQDHVADAYGADWTDDFCEKLVLMQESVSYAPRGKSGVSQKAYRTRKTVWDLVEDSHPDGDVYMGQTINEDKAGAVWAAHDDNEVVRVKTSEYDTYADTFGWKLLKDIDLYNLDDQFPSLDDDQLQRLGKTRVGGDSSESESLTRNRDPETRELKVRQSSSPGDYAKVAGKTIKNELDDDGTVSCDTYSSASELVLFPSTHDRSITGHYWLACGNTAVAKCPKYVYEYLSDVDNVYTYEEYINAKAATELDIHEKGPVAVEDIPTWAVIVVLTDDDRMETFWNLGGRLYDYLEDVYHELPTRDSMQYLDDDDPRSDWTNWVYMVSEDDIRDAQAAFSSASDDVFEAPQVLSTLGLSGLMSRRVARYDFAMYRDIVLADMPDCPEKDVVQDMGGRWNEDRAEVVETMRRILDSDEVSLASQDDEGIPSSAERDMLKSMSIRMSDKKIAVTETLRRASESDDVTLASQDDDTDE